jgi:MscS family membrane protein
MDELLGMTFLGKPASTWLLALAYLAGGIVVGLLLSWIFKNILGRIFARTKTRIDDILLASIDKPIVAIVVFLGIRMGVDTLTIEPGVAPWVSKVIAILIGGAVAWGIAKLFDGIVGEYLVPYVAKTESALDDQLLPILRKGGKLVIWTIAAVFAIKEAGYDIGAILAGLGIGGVALALAAKDTLSNFFGSMAVLIDRPFMINDRIKVAGFDGTIVEIGIRTSRLKTLDNRIVTLPNALFTGGAIENVSSEPSTKVPYVLELDPSIGLRGVEQALSALGEIAASIPELAEGTVAALSGFGQYSYKITFIVFVRRGADYFGTLNSLNLEILRRFAAEGIAFARPAMVVMDERRQGQ